MISRKALGVAGAAMLGTVAVLGVNVANAIDLDVDDEVITYAKESLVTTGVVEKEGKKYYVLKEDMDVADDGTGAFGGLDVHSDAIGLGIKDGGDDILVVRYTLTNMVFTADSDPSLALVGNNAHISEVAGGGSGDSTVTFVIRDADISGNIAANADIALDVDEIAVAENGGGSVSMEVVDRSLPDILNSTQNSAPNVIRVKSVVSQVATRMDLQASVDEGFTKFVDGKANGLRGAVGKLTVKVDTDDILNAADSTALAEEDVYKSGSGIEFAGDISFAQDVILADEDCVTDSESVLTGEGENRKFAEQTFADAHTAEGEGKYLCIVVNGETEIPLTEAYTATTKYATIDNAAFGPSNKGDNLGKITRGGTTVHIPYLTTSDRYNQRLVIVNRGSADATYELDFTPEEGTTHTAGDMAEGTVPAGKRVVLSLLNDDVVTLSGRSRTAATLTVNVSASAIDVATVQVNRSNGSTDTVSYQAE